MILALLACTPSEVEPTDPVEGGLTLPAPNCLDYEYLPLEGMGEPTIARREDFMSLDADGLQSTVDTLGYSVLGPFERGVDTWRIRYTTQDRGEPAEATSLLIVPQGVTGPLPVVLWMHHTAGANDDCAPSAFGLLGAGLPIIFAARLGVAVVAPDYLGLMGEGPGSPELHPYMVPEPTAISSLDALRAANRVAEGEAFELDLQNTAIWGASQGGHAALWADRYQRGYAPEIGIVGVAAGVPPTDMEALFHRATGEVSRTSDAVPAVIMAHANWFGLDATDLLRPEVATIVDETMRTSCDVLDAAGDIDEPAELFTQSFRDGGLPDDWQCALDDNKIVARLEPSGAPMFIVLGGEDQLVVAEPTRVDVDQLCYDGLDIKLLECTTSDHEDAAIDTLLDQERWIEDRLQGQTVPRACSTTVIECPPLGAE